MDKGFSLQFMGNARVPEVKREMMKELHDNGVLSKADGFLQGQSNDWLMVEFWTSDIDAIEKASERFAKKIGLTLERK
jgi:hypothetical protein